MLIQWVAILGLKVASLCILVAGLASRLTVRVMSKYESEKNIDHRNVSGKFMIKISTTSTRP